MISPTLASSQTIMDTTRPLLLRKQRKPSYIVGALSQNDSRSPWLFSYRLNRILRLLPS